MPNLSKRPGTGSVPVYSSDGQPYQDRVHQNGRPADQTFGAGEHLYRRYPKEYLRDGKPVPLAFQAFSFERAAGRSVNRGKYSLPEDVLEPDCCDGNFRSEYVVLQILVSELPAEIPASNGTTYRIRPAHRPKETCYSHSEIWCNEQGDIDQPYRRPPKDVRNLFYGELARVFAKRNPLDFAAAR